MTPSVTKRSPRMFESDFLERFSRAHPLTPALLYLPLIAFLVGVAIHRQTPQASVGGLVGGYLLWTLTEYWLHRLVFHLPVVGPKTARAAFLIHGVHHDHPRDDTRLVMPAGASLTLCALSFLAFRAVLGVTAMWAPLAGFVLGYVIYDEVHWYLHVGRPTSRFGRWLRREHLLHHFKEPGTRFGVSCPCSNHAFRTASTTASAKITARPASTR